MQRWTRTRPSTGAGPGPDPSALRDVDDDEVIELLLEVAIRRAGHAHWVAGRGARRWAARAATAGAVLALVLAAGGVPPAVLSPLWAAVAVPVLVWADHASRAWRGRTQHQEALGEIAEAVRTHAGSGDAAALLVDGSAAAAGLEDLRTAAMAVIDEAGCRAGHSSLCRHRRAAVVAA